MVNEARGEAVPRTAPAWTGWVVAGLAAVIGGAVRAWLLFHTPLNSDEAVPGLMAAQIRHGHFFTFYWGQAYGGVEPYAVAGLTWAAPHSAVLLDLVPVVLYAASSLLLWRLAARLGAAPVLAVAAGAALWVGPVALYYNSTRELGFRAATVLLGIGLMLLADRAGTGERPADWLGLGVVAGLGWWSSPEIVYFAVPAAGILASGLTTRRDLTTRRNRRSGIRGWARAAGGAVVAAAPWLYTNVGSRFASLRTTSSPNAGHTGYLSRLGVFFDHVVPIDLGARLLFNGDWLGGTVGRILFAAGAIVVVAALLFALVGFAEGRRRWILRSVAGGLVAMPFLYALFPATGYWREGIYGVFLLPLLYLLLALAADTLPDRRPVTAARRTGLAAALVAVVAVPGLVGFGRLWLGGSPRAYFEAWGDASAPAETAARLLTTAGVHRAYAQYWVAYDLDYLSGGRLVVATTATVRWPAAQRAVARDPTAAWLFYSPAGGSRDDLVFGSPLPGPGGLDVQQFESDLTRAHIGYRVVPAGLLTAVVPLSPLP